MKLPHLHHPIQFLATHRPTTSGHSQPTRLGQKGDVSYPQHNNETCDDPRKSCPTVGVILLRGHCRSSHRGLRGGGSDDGVLGYCLLTCLLVNPLDHRPQAALVMAVSDEETPTFLTTAADLPLPERSMDN